MGANTQIEWTDATWNPIGGCSMKSPGCINCYAQLLAGTRLIAHPLYAGTTGVVKGRVVFNGKLTATDDPRIWRWPVSWRGARQPKLGPGEPSLIFVGDMSDLFHEDREFDAIDRVVASIIHSRHIGQLLTKRPKVMCDHFDNLGTIGHWLQFSHPVLGIPNFDPMVATFARCVVPRLWLGCSVERQREADERREPMRMLAEMGFTTFVSYEPALGPVDWRGWAFVDQIISGGESGREDPRPSHPDWHRAARDFCRENGIAYFFKQWGAWAPHKVRPGGDLGGDVRAGRVTIVHPTGSSGVEVFRETGRNTIARSRYMERMSKRAAGRLLDGREHAEFPRRRLRAAA